MERFASIALVIGGLGLGLTIAEVGLRLLINARDSKQDRFRPRDPVLHHRLRPNARKVVRGVEYRTNSLGLRDHEYPERKPDGVFRVLMLGDSFTEGAGLAIDETVSKRVERRLSQGRCVGRYEVVNGGISSYSPILEYLLLQRLGPRLGPDLVVLNFDMSDVHDDFIRTAVAKLDRQGLPIAVPRDPVTEGGLVIPPFGKSPAWRFLDPLERLAHRSAIYQVIRRSVLGQKLLGNVRLTPDDLERLNLVGNVQYDIAAITRAGDYPGLSEAWATTERYIIAIKNLANAQRARFVLVAYPWEHQLVGGDSPERRLKFGVGPGSDRPFSMLEDFGRRDGFTVINLLPLFRDKQASEGPLFQRDDFHHNTQGAKVFADGILAGLIRLNMIPGCRVVVGVAGASPRDRRGDRPPAPSPESHSASGGPTIARCCR